MTAVPGPPASDQAVLTQLAQTLTLPDGFALFLLVTPVATHLDEARAAAERSGAGTGVVVSPYRDEQGRLQPRDLPEGWPDEVLQRLDVAGRAPVPGPVWLDATAAPPPQAAEDEGRDDAGWAALFRSMNQRRNVLVRDLGRPLVLVLPVRLLRRFAHEAPDFWSIRSESVYVPLPESAPGGADWTAALVELGELHPLQAELGQRTDHATALVAEARARMAESDAPVHAAALASALGVLARGEASQGRVQEALSHAEEAVRIWRDLAVRNAAGYLANLAASSNDLSVLQRNIGRRDEALATAEEAVRRYRELAKHDRDAFLGGLATSQNNLAIAQSAVGQREAALTTAQEAVSNSRDLAERDRDAFLPGLALALSNLANRYSDLDQSEAALATAEEAVRYFHDLACRDPNAFLPGLASALNNLANRQLEAGHPELALAAQAEAVTRRRELVSRNRGAFAASLATSLNNLALTQMILGRAQAALANAEEAWDVQQQLYLAAPEAMAEPFARTCAALAHIQSAAGRHAQAATTAARGAHAVLPLAERHPAALAGVVAALVRVHIEASKSAGLEPDASLLERARPVLATVPPPDDVAPGFPSSRE